MNDEQTKDPATSGPTDGQDMPAVTLEGELQAVTAEREER